MTEPLPQSLLIESLQNPQVYSHPVERVERIETHISTVLLAGDYAYKIKKPLDLGFLDFSTLDKRHRCCEEEIRLNRRLAPELYLDVVAITGTPASPRLEGTGEPIEYAVKMRRFNQAELLSRSTALDPPLMEAIAEVTAAFHATIPAAAPDSEFGEPSAVFFPMQQNFDQIRGLTDDPVRLSRLDPLEHGTQARYERLTPLLTLRKQQGFIRECHGDMHLGNITRVDGTIRLFDGIEFNPALRWIDTLNEVAFFVMDLEQAGQAGLANRFLNTYLDLTGDFEGLPLLVFYKLYRALVRAKVTAFRVHQPGLTEAERQAVWQEFDRYLTLAEYYTQAVPPVLILVSGVTGSGKSYLARPLAAELGALHVRSDVERKRLFGLSPLARSLSGLQTGLYTPEASARTYARLREIAAILLETGLSVVVEATFLRAGHRAVFQALAERWGVGYRCLSISAPEALLRERVVGRLASGLDPSEATLEVLDQQLGSRIPCQDSERPHWRDIDGTHPPEMSDLVRFCRIQNTP
ncbi:MAG: AAA family ATPase [Pseudomonadota bacterium]